jgi:hypothetical protein
LLFTPISYRIHKQEFRDFLVSPQPWGTLLCIGTGSKFIFLCRSHSWTSSWTQFVQSSNTTLWIHEKCSLTPNRSSWGCECAIIFMWIVLSWYTKSCMKLLYHIVGIWGLYIHIFSFRRFTVSSDNIQANVLIDPKIVNQEDLEEATCCRAWISVTNDVMEILIWCIFENNSQNIFGVYKSKTLE